MEKGEPLSEHLEPETAHPRGAPSRLALALVAGPILVMVAAGYLADALWADLVNSNPLLLLVLSARNRYLVLVVNQLEPVVYYVVGSLRLLAPDPFFYVLGWWYGDAAVTWMEGRTATYGQLLRKLEILFRRWGHPLVFLFPNNPICLFAGASRMPVPVFAALNVTGTIARLILVAIVGDALSDPIDVVLGFVADYRIPILIVSVVLVAFTLWSETRQGSSEIDQLRRLEHLDDTDPPKGDANEAAQGGADDGP